MAVSRMDVFGKAGLDVLTPTPPDVSSHMELELGFFRSHGPKDRTIVCFFLQQITNGNINQQTRGVTTHWTATHFLGNLC